MIQTALSPAQSAPPLAPAARSRTLYLELADTVQQLIDQQTLRPGHRVPSVRQMARQRDVSVATVVQAYTMLEDRGYLEARPQSGFYVRARQGAGLPEPRKAPTIERPAYVSVADLGHALMSRSGDPSLVPLGAACPDPSLFPTKKLGRLLGSVARHDPSLLGRYSLAPAHEPLAREIARRYLQAGAPLPHDELVVTVGCIEAIHLSLRAVTSPGDTVALETPTYFGFLELIQSLGLKALEIPSDPRTGLCIECLREALGQHAVKALLLMPSFHNPLGSSMPDSHKAELYQLARERDLPIIEDDIYGDLHHGTLRPKPLKAWDTDGRVLLCSSFGKTLAPGLRVGWCAPGRYLERVRRLKFTQTMGTPVVLQKAVADFLREGGYDHHLRSIRRAYRRQVELFSTAIQKYFPAGTSLTRPTGGFILWVELPVKVDTLRLHDAALAKGINTAPGPIFSAQDRYRHCLRLNCGLPWSDKLDAALKTLGELSAAQLR